MYLKSGMDPETLFVRPWTCIPYDFNIAQSILSCMKETIYSYPPIDRGISEAPIKQRPIHRYMVSNVSSDSQQESGRLLGNNTLKHRPIICLGVSFRIHA